MKQIVNLTPHSINVISGDGECVLSLPPSGVIARVTIDPEPLHPLYFKGVTIPVSRPNYGRVTGLPQSEDGVVYIVSTMVREASPRRVDVFSPGDLCRDDAGQPIGCRNFYANGGAR